MPQRTIEVPMKAVADVQEQVLQDSGVMHEDAMWDASEMALDGASKESMVERLKQARSKPCVSKGRWPSA
jgi:U3 small nucleolar RNA-associated protein 14